MINIKFIRIFVLIFLFLTTFVLTSVKSTAQSRSISPSLEGTKWTEAIMSGLQITENVYYFSDKGTVHAAHTITTYASDVTKFDATTGTYKSEPANPGTVLSILRAGETGTYKQDGNSILMEFSVGYQIEARIENDRLVGKLITTDGRNRAWSAEKVFSNNTTIDEKQNISDKVFGPWGSSENLRSAIVKMFHEYFDEMIAKGIIVGGVKERIADDEPMPPKIYSDARVNLRIADKLNQFFNKKIFKPEDFLPPDKKYIPRKDGLPPSIVDQAHYLNVSSYIRDVYTPAVRRVLSQSPK